MELPKNCKPPSKKRVILILMIPYKQLSLANIFQDYQNKFGNGNPAFLSLLENHIDIDEIVPISFRNHFMHQRAEPVNTLCMLFCGL